jgi:hypothetical protein
VLGLKTRGEIRDYLGRRVQELCPEAAMMDTAL